MPGPSSQSEDLVELIETLKTGAFDVVTQNRGELVDDEYKRTRKIVLSHPELGKLAPEWLRKAATAWEVRTEVSRLAGDFHGKWQRRREIVASGLNPLLDALQGAEIAADLNLEKMERLGGGGFGEVYRYRHKLIEVDFAVKILDPAFAADGDRGLERFLREARILFRLHHYNIVRIYDVGMVGRRPFIRTELVEGQTLNARLADAGSLSVADAHRIALQLARALRHAHAESVIHRDIKPSNVMTTADGRTVLLDFGLGVFVEGDIVSRITKTGERAAGGLYTAPELVADAKLLDPRTDVYSLGALAFTLLTGRPPAGVRVEKTLSDIPSVAKAFSSAILDCLGPLDGRPTADELADRLRDLD